MRIYVADILSKCDGLGSKLIHCSVHFGLFVYLFLGAYFIYFLNYYMCFFLASKLPFEKKTPNCCLQKYDNHLQSM